VNLLSNASLQRKLLAVILLTTVVALFVALTAMIVYDLRAYHQGWIADITAQAELLGRTTAPALNFNDPKAAKEDLELLRFRSNVRAAAVYNPRGSLFATYAASAAEERYPKLPEADGVRVEGRELIVFKRIENGGEILGTVYVRADYELFNRIIDYLGIAVAVMAFAMLVAYVLSSRLQAPVTRPILAITDVAREVVANRDYSRRAERMSNDEIGLLAQAFNDMLAEIERRTSAIETSNRELEREVGERARAEKEILRLNEQLETRVQERTAQLESTNKELEAFSFSVSHDLRAPLRSIDGFSHALLDDCADRLPEEGRRYLTRIRMSTERMAQLIEDLLNLSRVSRGAIEKRELNFSDLARDVAADLRHREPNREVEVTVWDGLAAVADSRLLRAALENLIGNAWKFTSKAPDARIEVGALRDGEQTTYFVRDNGAGFDMAYADKLFGAFQRLHGVSDFPGTGIGLATVQRIVARHGGRIWADAQVGKGATFFFTLAPDAVLRGSHPADSRTGA
jgi:signal transduction histidine kinase